MAIKDRLLIIGAGPRGLAVALNAVINTNIEIVIIDNKPLSTWNSNYMVSDLQMRSPISFDLTTYNENLKEYSLSYYMGYNKFFTSQEDVELVDVFCTRNEFVSYLHFIVKFLKNRGVKFLRSKVDCITLDHVTCENINIKYDYLVIATGRSTQVKKIPRYLNSLNIIPDSKIYTSNWYRQKINVIGSGQQSAELVHYLATQQASVTWIQKYAPKINQYPLPSFKEWGIKSALGNYYKKYCYDKPNYLKKVKEWGPSITPYISNKLSEVKYGIIKNPETTKEIDTNTPFIVATGFTQDVRLLNFKFEIELEKASLFPKLTLGFRSRSNTNIYFTGLLSMRHDGPRQGSLISSGLTANQIVSSF